jgi:hypothetical protein
MANLSASESLQTLLGTGSASSKMSSIVNAVYATKRNSASSRARSVSMSLVHELGDDLRSDTQREDFFVPPSSHGTFVTITSRVNAKAVPEQFSRSYVETLRRRSVQDLLKRFDKLMSSRGDSRETSRAAFLDRIQEEIHDLRSKWVKFEGNSVAILRLVRDVIYDACHELLNPDKSKCVREALVGLAQDETIGPADAARFLESFDAAGLIAPTPDLFVVDEGSSRDDG